MARTGEQGAPAARSRPAGLVFFAIAVGALAVGETALVLQDNPVPWGWTAALFPLGGCVYVATGLLAWVRRPRNRMGPLLCAGGLLWFAAGAVNVSDVIDQRSSAVINHFNLLMTGWGPTGPQPWNYFFRRDGVCESADAAAVFSAFVDDGFDNTRAAADAAFAPVWRLLAAIGLTPSPTCLSAWRVMS